MPTLILQPTMLATQRDQCAMMTLIVMPLLMQLLRGPGLYPRRDQPAALPTKTTSSICKYLLPWSRILSFYFLHFFYNFLSIISLHSDEGFIEPPAKKAKSGAAPPDVATSEASVPKAAPAAQASTVSSLSKGKDAPSTAAARTPPSVSPSRLRHEPF